MRLKSPDGDGFEALIQQATHVEPQTGALEFRMIVRNLKREREQESALKAAEERFRRFFDFAPVAVATVGREGRIMEANPAFRALSVAGVDLIGASLGDFVDAEHRDDVARVIAAAWRGNAPEGALEILLEDSLGARRMQLYLSRLADAGGVTNALLLHFVDTTEQHNLEAQFAQSQKMQAVGQLAGGIAHDFNNLLTAIIGHSDLLMLRLHPGDEAFPDIMQIRQNANRAANLVRQLLGDEPVIS